MNIKPIEVDDYVAYVLGKTIFYGKIIKMGDYRMIYEARHINGDTVILSVNGYGKSWWKSTEEEYLKWMLES